MNEFAQLLIVLIVVCTVMNIALFAFCLKVYTEIMKEKPQRARSVS